MPEQAAKLQAWGDLMRQIAELSRAEGWKQTEATERCAVAPPRIDDLLRGHASHEQLLQTRSTWPYSVRPHFFGLSVLLNSRENRWVTDDLKHPQHAADHPPPIRKCQ
jgi:hypothetical protein